MYEELQKEQAELRSDLQEKREKIAEIDHYLSGLPDREESSPQVPLPEKAGKEDKELEKKKLTVDCEEIEKQIYLDENRMEQLQNFLSGSSTLHVKQLSILDAQEKERQRIARDLHDTSLQNLTHLVHMVELSSLYIDEDPVKAKLELATVEKLIHKVIEEIRNSLFALRPMAFDDLGLKEAIEKLLTVLNQDNKFYISTDIDSITVDTSDVSEQIKLLSMYRIVQEGVQNAIKHSGGSKISVNVKEDDSFYRIDICDNGTGFDLGEALKKDKHFGLSVIKERVAFLDGTINIDGHNGTFIAISIPRKSLKL